MGLRPFPFSLLSGILTARERTARMSIPDERRARDSAAAVAAVRTAPALRLRVSTFDSLRHRDYRLLWTGVLFTSGGMWMEQVALNWLVYDMTGSAVQLGVLNGLRALPSLVTGLLGGVAADRMDRKRLMIWTQWVLLVLYTILAAIILLDRVAVWHLMLFTLATGVVWTFNQPVRQAILPRLVPKEDLMNAVALQSAAFNMTRVIGPAVGGLLIALIGAGGAIAAEAVTWVAVLALTYPMRVPPLPPRAPDAPGVRHDLAEGLRYVARTPAVRGLLVMAMLPFVLIMPYMTLLTIFAKEIFHMDVAGLGLLMSISGVGALAATLGVASLGHFSGKGRLLFAAAVTMSVTLIGFALSPWLPLSYLALIAVSGSSMAYMALSNTLVNLIVPDAFRGRVMSVYMLDRGLMPLGSLFAGVVAAVWGAPAALVLMGVAGLICSAAFLGPFANVRRLE
jgi:MFS family permease